MTQTTGDVIAEVRGQIGCITLNRPKALNALSLGMVRDLMGVLLAWRNDPQRCRTLRFISLEKHPFAAADLAIAHAAWPEFAELATQLQAQWPLLTPGVHRLFLDNRLGDCAGRCRFRRCLGHDLLGFSLCAG